MSNSEELWEVIQKQILDEELVNADQLTDIKQRIITGRVTVEDWSFAIESSLFTEEENGE